MHIKKRGNNVTLYRSVWVPKGVCGNTHGFSQQKFVASMREDSTTVPTGVAVLLTPEETTFVEQRVCAPAKAALAEAAAAAATREADPIWRIHEAVRLLEDAALRSATVAVSEAYTNRIGAAVAKFRTYGQSTRPSAPAPQSDPLRDALNALHGAAQAVRAGRYGNGPVEGMKSTPIYARWLELQEALDGASDESLMRCLQARGFVKTRQR